MINLKPCISVKTAMSMLTMLCREDNIGGIPLSVLTKESGSVYKTASDALDYLLVERMVKSVPIDPGKRTGTAYIHIIPKGERTLKVWCNE